MDGGGRAPQWRLSARSASTKEGRKDGRCDGISESGVSEGREKVSEGKGAKVESRIVVDIVAVGEEEG